MSEIDRLFEEGEKAYKAKNFEMAKSLYLKAIDVAKRSRGYTKLTEVLA